MQGPLSPVRIFFVLVFIAALTTATKANTINVNSLTDTLANNGTCTIREAVINANNDAATWSDCAAGSGPDVINLPAGTITFTLNNSPNPATAEELSLTGDLDLTSDITINGHVDGTTIDAATIDRIFDINPDTDGLPETTPPEINVSINRLNIINGRQNDVGAVRILLNATVAIDSTTISNNTSWANDSGGIFNAFGAELTLTNSTVSGNFALLLAGGIKNEGTMTMLSCTVTNNSSSFANLITGVLNSAVMTVGNSIIAGNGGTELPNFAGVSTSLGYNIVGSLGTSGFNPFPVPGPGDQIGVSDAAILLGPLQPNGGATPTHALGVGSIAIDQGHSFTLTTDQRGETRPCDQAGITNAVGGDGADVGAFEVQGACFTNTPPTALDDDYDVDQDTPLNVVAPGVLGNDSDPDADTLSAVLVTGPANAQSFALNADGSFAYTPNPGFIGVDSFTYKANDGSADSNVATVTITVNDTEPPDITASVAVDTLWAPNHALVNVGLNFSATDNSGDPVTTSVTVFSNEDDVYPGSGENFSSDAKDIAAGTLRLRSERSGTGPGRVYLILIVATDSSNNVSRTCLAVVVPKSQTQADIDAVNQLAATARAACEATGAAPAGYFVVGDGPVVGPIQ
jgi:hypothetical protein